MSKRVQKSNLKKSFKLKGGETLCDKYAKQYSDYMNTYQNENNNIQSLLDDIETLNNSFAKSSIESLNKNAKLDYSSKNEFEKLQVRLELYNKILVKAIELITNALTILKSNSSVKKQGGRKLHRGSGEDSSDSKADFDLDAEIAKIGKAFDDKTFKTLDKFLADNYEHTCFNPIDELIIMVNKTIDDSINGITKIFNNLINILPRVQTDLFSRVQTRLEQINVILAKCDVNCLKPLTPEEMKIECGKIKCIPSKYTTVNEDDETVFGKCKTDDSVCNNIKKMCKLTTGASVDKEVCPDTADDGKKTDKVSGMAHAAKAVVEINKLRKSQGKGPITNMNEADKEDTDSLEQLIKEGKFTEV